MYKKKQILASIGTVARKLGRAPSRAEFAARSGISQFFVLQWFGSWSDAVRAAGLQPYTRHKRIEERALLEDWGKAVRRKRGLLPRHIYRREGKYNPCTLAKHFGGWTRVPLAFRNFAKGKREWRDVLALLPDLPPKEKRVPIALRNGGLPFAVKNEGRVPTSIVRASSGVSHYKALKDRGTYGNPLHFPGFRHEPVNEQGVVLLFGMLAKDLGFSIEAVQSGFPDCEAKRQIGPDRWQRVRIEFEFESRNFHQHGHSVNGCDVIVCWRHNWPTCPKHIEVLELCKIVESCR